MLFVSCSLTVSQERPHPLSLLGSPASSSISEMTYSPGGTKGKSSNLQWLHTRADWDSLSTHYLVPYKHTTNIEDRNSQIHISSTLTLQSCLRGGRCCLCHALLQTLQKGKLGLSVTRLAGGTEMGQFVSVRLSQQMNLLRLSTESNEQPQFPHHFMLDMLFF